jgi:hypothetical protein
MSVRSIGDLMNSQRHSGRSSRELAERQWGQPATDLFQPRRRGFQVLAVVLFATVFALDVIVDQAGLVPLLYVLPVALLAASSGVSIGLGAALIATALTIVAGTFDGPHSLLAYVVCGSLFLLVGALGKFRHNSVEWWLGWLPGSGLGTRTRKLFLFGFGFLVALAGVSLASSQSDVVNAYNAQQAAREEDVRALRALSRTLLDALDDEHDEDELRSLQLVMDALQQEINRGLVQASVIDAVAELRAEVEEGNLDAAQLVKELNAGDDPVVSLRNVHTAHVLVPTSPVLTSLAEHGASSIDRNQLAEFTALVEEDLPNSRAARALREQPEDAELRIEHDESGGPDWAVVTVETIVGPVALELIKVAIAVCVRRRRKGKRKTLDAARIQDAALPWIEGAFGSKARVVRIEPTAGKEETQLEIVLDGERRVRCRVATNGEVRDAFELA